MKNEESKKPSLFIKELTTLRVQTGIRAGKKKPPYTTLALGEEDPYTTLALGEEDVITK